MSPSPLQLKSMCCACFSVHQPDDEPTLVVWLCGQASMFCATTKSLLLREELWLKPCESSNVLVGSDFTAMQRPQEPVERSRPERWADASRGRVPIAPRRRSRSVG